VSSLHGASGTMSRSMLAKSRASSRPGSIITAPRTKKYSRSPRRV
jgi:hypothetical protein